MARTQFNAFTYNTKYAQAVAKHYQNRLQAIFDTMYQEAAKIGKGTGFNDPAKEFYLKDFPKASAKIDALLRTISGKVESLITDGTDKAWNLSYEKNHAMVKDLADRYGIDEERVDTWSKRNLASLTAFQGRREKGLNLSQRVWDFMKHDKAKMELALELGLGEGKSADALSRDIREYLQEPKKLFRRVRDKDGNLRLSKNAQAYHPGRGVYRSSYKNAMRVTRTEINMAYRTADYEAWNGMPFVTGQIIHLSASHPVEDMCDDLAGTYPKEFKFTGWHPHCLCYVTAKLASKEEMRKYGRMTDAEQAGYQFENKVTEMPANYNNWISENAARINSAASMPYFIKDNYVGGVISKGLIYQQDPRNLPFLTPQDIPGVTTPVDEKQGRTRDEILAAAKARQEARTQEEVYDIQDRWALRNDERQYTEEQRSMFREIEKALGVERGFSMPYLRADQQNANPNYSLGHQYHINCQTCAPTYVMREWGFDVIARGNTELTGNLSYYLSGLSHWDEIWLNPAGQRKGFRSLAKDMHANGWKMMNKQRYKETLEKLCHSDGTYAITTLWKGGGGHATIIKRKNGKLSYVEPQHNNAIGSGNERRDFDYLCDTMTAKPHLLSGVLRVDNALVDIKRFGAIFEPGKAVSLHQQRILNETARVKEITTLDELRAARKAMNSSDPKIREMYINKAKELRHAQRDENAIREAWGNRVTGKIAGAKTLDELKAIRKTYTGNNADIRQAFIDKAKEIRIATRDAKAIQTTWNKERIEKHGYAEKVEKMRGYISKYGLDGKALDDILAGELKFTKAGKCTALDKVEKEYETKRLEIVTKKTAENVANVALKTPWVDQADIDKLKAIKDVSELKKATKEMAKKIAGINADIKELEKVIPNAGTWAKQFSSGQLHGVADAIEKKLNWIENNAPYYGGSNALDQAKWKQKKINQEIVKLATDTTLQSKYSTWKVSQAAYTAESAKYNGVITKLEQQQILDQLDIYAAKYTNSKVLLDLVDQAKQAYTAGNITDFNAFADKVEKKAKKLESDRKRNAKNSNKLKTPENLDNPIDFDVLDDADARKLFDDFEKTHTEKADKILRPQTENIWAGLTEEERVVLTKYTETYSYLNEPLRGIDYRGGRTWAEFEHDMPLMTGALAKCKAGEALVVRRGTGNYVTTNGKSLDALEAGDEFIDGAFLSTAVHKDYGFHQSYSLEIIVPKGAEGIYAEPFTHFNDSGMLNSYDNVWNGTDEMSMGGEREFIGQRGAKFRVISKNGNTIYLQMVGQRYSVEPNLRARFR